MKTIKFDEGDESEGSDSNFSHFELREQTEVKKESSL